MPNVGSNGVFIKDGGIWKPADPSVHLGGSFGEAETVEVKMGGVWKTIWQAGPTWGPLQSMRPVSVTYHSTVSFNMNPENAIDASTSTFWMSGLNSGSESSTAYESIRVNIGDPAGVNRWVGIAFNCYANYEMYMGIRKPGGSWEGSIFPNPTYTGSQGSQVQHAYADGGNQGGANRLFSLNNREDLANAEIQLTATKLTQVSGYSNFRMLVYDILVYYETQE